MTLVLDFNWLVREVVCVFVALFNLGNDIDEVSLPFDWRLHQELSSGLFFKASKHMFRCYLLAKDALRVEASARVLGRDHCVSNLGVSLIAQCAICVGPKNGPPLKVNARWELSHQDLAVSRCKVLIVAPQGLSGLLDSDHVIGTVVSASRVFVNLGSVAVNLPHLNVEVLERKL